jgi:RNA polymerase sigma-70 factor (ECF subfamily)
MTDWNAIVREFGPAVWRTAYRLLSREADAADCFQRTFLCAVELDAAEPVRNWPALLKRLATARALEQLRTRYRESRRAAEFPDEPPADRGSPDPADLACGGELAAALRQALSAIDAQQAEVFCLVCVEGFTNAEAAVAMGVTANHAGVLLHRARAALRERLRAFDPNREHLPGGHP